MITDSTDPGPGVTEPVISASGITKTFGELTAVDGVSFKVHRGETYGLLGPNGAGKTTTMRLLSALSPLTVGIVDRGGAGCDQPG